MRRRVYGYSLYELLVTLAIASLLIVIGVPMLAGSVSRSRQSVEINALFHAIHLARKESIVRRRPVSLCPSLDGESCEPGRDWSGGWILFVNEDGDRPPMLDDGEAVLDRHSASEGIRVTANRHGFTLRAIHRRATNGTFVVCDAAGRIPPKALVVSWTGRPRVAFETTRGDPYSCLD